MRTMFFISVILSIVGCIITVIALPELAAIGGLLILILVMYRGITILFHK